MTPNFVKVIAPYGDTLDCKIIDTDGVTILYPVKITIIGMPNSLFTMVAEFEGGSIREFEGVILGTGV